MNSALMFSKASDEWATPLDFWEELHREFDFEVDAAATILNRKRVRYFGPDHINPAHRDALTVRWADIASRLWLNPPYSRCREFIAKAALERNRRALIVALVPSRTDTRWFHEHLWDSEKHSPKAGIELRFIRGRLKFGEGKNSAPFPSMVVVFRP